MESWTCPECGRLFARRRQSHDCAPGLTMDEYFATGPEHERAVFDAVMDHARTLGPVHADFVAVGVFLKNPKKFADLRPRSQWVALGFSLERRPRIAQSPGRSFRTAHGSGTWRTFDRLPISTMTSPHCSARHMTFQTVEVSRHPPFGPLACRSRRRPDANGRAR